jgi:hypothetical protein
MTLPFGAGSLGRMPLLAVLLRLLIVAALAAGVGLPAGATPPPAQEHWVHAHAHHDTTAGTKPMPDDDACRRHCLALTFVLAETAATPRFLRATRLNVAPLREEAASLWPQPEDRPPRV